MSKSAAENKKKKKHAEHTTWTKAHSGVERSSLLKSSSDSSRTREGVCLPLLFQEEASSLFFGVKGFESACVCLLFIPYRLLTVCRALVLFSTFLQLHKGEHEKRNEADWGITYLSHHAHVKARSRCQVQAATQRLDICKKLLTPLRYLFCKLFLWTLTQCHRHSGRNCLLCTDLRSTR